MQSSLTKTSRWLACAGLAIGLTAVTTVEAGFKGAIAGTGFPTGGVVPVGPLQPTALAFVNKIKALNPGFSDAQARAKGIALHLGVCKAIDAVTAQNATVGACLKKLKSNGLICISFDMKGAYGVASSDGKPACNENDKININAGVFTEGCPPPHDPNLYWLTTTLLHEGTHAIQDFGITPSGDVCKDRATRIKKLMCNEAGTGVGADPKGAHVIENEWIVQLQEAIDSLNSPSPVSLLGWSDATQAIFNALFALDNTTDTGNGKTARANAIEALQKAINDNKASNDLAIACYRKGKAAFDVFLAADISTIPKKVDALLALRSALNQAKWKSITFRFSLLRKVILSDATSGIIEQPGSAPLDTGMLGISDMELIQGTHLLVFGEGVGGGSIRVYFDSNVDGVFQSTELVTAHDNMPTVPIAGDLVVHQNLGSVLLYDYNSAVFFQLDDSDFDGVPDQFNPVPAFISPDGPDYFITEWEWFLDTASIPLPQDLLIAYDIQDSMRPVSVVESRFGFVDGSGLGIPEGIIFQGPVIDYAPTWGGNPIAGDSTMDVYSFPGVQSLVISVDPVTFSPLEILGVGTPLSLDPVSVTLSRPLNVGETIIVASDRNPSQPLSSVALEITPCIGNGPDINGDFVVNGADLGLLLGSWGTANPCTDLNGDGITDGADLGLLLGAWGAVSA